MEAFVFHLSVFHIALSVGLIKKDETLYVFPEEMTDGKVQE